MIGLFIVFGEDESCFRESQFLIRYRMDLCGVSTKFGSLMIFLRR